jgi:hypothetical protein
MYANACSQYRRDDFRCQDKNQVDSQGATRLRRFPLELSDISDDPRLHNYRKKVPMRSWGSLLAISEESSGNDISKAGKAVRYTVRGIRRRFVNALYTIAAAAA